MTDSLRGQSKREEVGAQSSHTVEVDSLAVAPTSFPWSQMLGCTCADPEYHPDPRCPACRAESTRFEVGYQ